MQILLVEDSPGGDGGGIGVESELDQGSLFHFTLSAEGVEQWRGQTIAGRQDL